MNLPAVHCVVSNRRPEKVDVAQRGGGGVRMSSVALRELVLGVLGDGRELVERLEMHVLRPTGIVSQAQTLSQAIGQKAGVLAAAPNRTTPTTRRPIIVHEAEIDAVGPLHVSELGRRAKEKLTEGNARVSLEFFANRCLRGADHASVVCVRNLDDIARATHFAGSFDLAGR